MIGAVRPKLQIVRDLPVGCSCPFCDVISKPNLSLERDRDKETVQEMHSGSLTVEYNGQKQNVRLQLLGDTLLLQKEELAYTYSPTNHVDAAILARERVVHIKREKVGGLGLSVKGGAEHNLPILISRIFKDQAADRTGQLFVGDAILKVNSVSLDSYCHDEAVSLLKNAGDDVTLAVKYFHPASLFLNKTSRRNSRLSSTDDDNNQISNTSGNSLDSNENENVAERQWTDIVSVPLLCAYVTRYKPGSDELWASSFEVTGLDGESTGPIQCEDSRVADDWVHTIQASISTLNNQSILLTNKTLLPNHHVVHMCWVCERIGASKLWQAWKRKFLVFKGPEICIYETPPIKDRDWEETESTYKIHQCMFKIIKSSTEDDSTGRQHSFLLETGSGESHYLSVETRGELLKIEKAWYHATYQAVKHIQSETFGCSWREEICGLTLDLNSGFSLYDSQTKEYLWSYRFSQLKSSSDDGESRLVLIFLNEDTNHLETKEVECTNLRTLLYTIHAFLSAKLASVDPNFLLNL